MSHLVEGLMDICLEVPFPTEKSVVTGLLQIFRPKIARPTFRFKSAGMPLGVPEKAACVKHVATRDTNRPMPATLIVGMCKRGPLTD